MKEGPRLVIFLTLKCINFLPFPGAINPPEGPCGGGGRGSEGEGPTVRSTRSTPVHQSACPPVLLLPTLTLLFLPLSLSLLLSLSLYRSLHPHN